MREKDIATNEFMTWEYFLSNFEDNYNCSATAAVNILREVYGINRRVLVLVDELAKLDDDANEKVVMREIGQLLTSSHKIDVIVSALSPEYVDTLVTRTSARVIKYVILDSLVGSRLGRNETREWSVELLREYGKSDEEIDEFAINFLCNIELLLSGHPRSLQRLVESFAAKSEWGLYWTNTIELIRDAKIESKGTMPEIMKAVMDDLFGTEDNPVYSLLETKIPGTPTKIVKYLDLALQFVVPENPQFRSYLENGAVYILPKTSYTPKRRTTIPLVTFLQLVSILAEPKVYPRLLASHSRARTAVLLFKNSTVNMAELFESAVGLTAVCHSYLAISSYMKTLLGCKRVKNCIPKIRTPPLTTRIASSLEEMMIPESGLVANEYVHAPKYFPGFDGRITVMNTVGKDSAHYFYMEVRIAPKKRDSESKARVSKIVKALMSHFICTLQLSLTDQLSSFKNLHVIFYEWGALSDTNEVDLEAVKSAVSSLFAGKTIESVEETNNAHKNDDLLSARQKFLEDVKKVLQDADKNSDAMISNIQKRLLSDDHMREYMRQCFQAYLDAGDDVGKKTHLARAYVVTRQELEQWLVPPVLPIPYLVAEVEKAATDGQTIDADEA